MSRAAFFKEVVKQSGSYGLALFARRALSLLMVPVSTRYLSTTEYGVAELLEMTLSLLGLLFGLRFGESLLYFYAQAKTPAEQRDAVSAPIIGSLLVGGAAMAAGQFFTGPLSDLVLGSRDYAGLMRLSLVNLLFLFPTEVGFGYLRATNRTALYVLLSAIRPMVSFAITMTLMIGYGLKVEAFIWANIVTFGLLAIYMVWFCFSRAGISFHPAALWKQIRYGAPLIVHGLSMMVIHQGDRFFLRPVVTLADIGIYALAYKTGMLISYVQASFEQYWRAQVFHLVRRADGEHLYVRTTTYLLLVLTLCGLAIVVFVDPALGLLVHPKFHSARQYIPPLVAAYLMRAAADQFRTIFRTEARTGGEAGISLLSSLFCLANYAVLIPWLGLWGAVAATVSSFAFFMTLSYHRAQRLKRYPFELGRLARIALAAVLAALPTVLYRWPSLSQQLLAGCAQLAAFPILLLIFRFPGADEIRYLRSLKLTADR